MTDSLIKVGFCENGAGYGGAIISLVAFLQNIPADITPYIYTSLGTERYQRLAEIGRWHHIPSTALIDPRTIMRTKMPCASMIDNLCNIAPYALKLYRSFKRENIALVYLNNDPSCNLAAALAANFANIPIVLHARGFSADTRGNRWVLSKVSHCIAVSKAVKKQLVELGIADNKCTVVAEGLDLQVFSPRPPSKPILEELGLTESNKIITLVGGLIDWKGQDILLDACPTIFQHYPEARILLVGSAYGKDSDFANMIVDRVRTSSLKNRVQFLGARDDVADILSVSSIVVHASTKPEPFGRTFLEGMAMKKPVIASNEGGPSEVITNEVDGLLISPRDPSVLAQAIIRLLDDRLFADSIANRAFDTASNYSIAKHAEALTLIIRGFHR